MVLQSPMVIYFCGRKQQLLLFGMLKRIFYLWSELKYLKLIAIWYSIFYYIACLILLLKTKTKTKIQLLVFLLWWLPKNPLTGIQPRYSMAPVEKSDLIKCLAINPVVYMLLLPFLLGHCFSHFAGLWDSRKQWIFSLCKNNKWEERKYWHIEKDKKGRKLI